MITFFTLANLKKNKIELLLIVYSALWLFFYLVEPIRKKILREESQTLQNNSLFIIIGLSLLVLLIFYFFIFLEIKKRVNLNFKKIFFISIIVNLFLLFVWPIASCDLFHYIQHGRVLGVFRENPYTNSYSNFNHDPFFNKLENKLMTLKSPYGPLFIIINGAISLISKNNITLNLFLLKFFFVVLNIFTGYFIYKISKNIVSFYLYAFNPLILFEFSINGHNDILLIFFIIAFFLFYKKSGIKNNLISFTFLVLSFLTKFIPIIFLPIFILTVLSKLKTNKERIYFSLASLLIFSLLTIALYGPFIKSPEDIIRPMILQSKTIGIFMSPLIILLIGILRKITTNPIPASIIIGKIAFVIFYFFVIIKIIKNKFKQKNEKEENIYELFGITILFFYLSFFSWLMPWYFTSIILIFALNYCFRPKQQYLSLLAIFGSTFYGLLYYLFLR